MKKILIVDDSPHMLRALGRMLRSRGLAAEQIVTAKGVDEAVMVFQTDPEIVFVMSDVMMGVRNGTDLHRFLAADLAIRDATFVACTGGCDRQFLDYFAFAGVEVLDKPINPEKIGEIATRYFT